MSFLPRLSVLVVLTFGSVALLACSGSSDSENASVVGQPLIEACRGTYVCTADGSNETSTVTLGRGDLGLCMAGQAYFEKDQKLTTDAGGHKLLGIWTGDTAGFDICSSDGCVHCKPQDSSSSAPGGAPSGGASRCSGSTSCSGYGAGDCSTHQGCSMHSHAVYSFGKLDHYENECQGSTPSCSSHGTADECTRQGCTWQ
jgi:hypothetical protein